MDTAFVNLWHGELEASPQIINRYWPLLSGAERQYVETLHNPQVRQRYVEVRGRLRLTLGQWLDAQPELLRIDKTAHGKPYLADYPDHAFNLSHCANVLALAAGQNCQLGVDIEQCKPRANLTGLVNKCFAETEIAYWQGLPQSERETAFYQIWTIKEAFVKATGLGIKLGLQRCVVNPETMDALLTIPEDFGESRDWQIFRFDLTESMFGAVVLNNSTMVNKMEKLVMQPLPKL